MTISSTSTSSSSSTSTSTPYSSSSYILLPSTITSFIMAIQDPFQDPIQYSLQYSIQDPIQQGSLIHESQFNLTFTPISNSMPYSMRNQRQNPCGMPNSTLIQSRQIHSQFHVHFISDGQFIPYSNALSHWHFSTLYRLCPWLTVDVSGSRFQPSISISTSYSAPSNSLSLINNCVFFPSC